MIGSLLSLAGTACLGAKEYSDCFGFIRGLALLVLTIVWPRSKAWKVKVAIPGRPGSVLVRPGTTDPSVFNTTFRSRQYNYDFIKPPSVIVDAGAYTGLSAAYFATRFPEATVIAIEPDGGNFDLLVRNTSRLKNVHPVRAALWSNSGMIELTDPGQGDWAFRVAGIEDSGSSAGLRPEKAPGNKVPAVTIPDILDRFNLPHIDLLKLDIEGSEKEVLADCASWIADVGAICVELHDRFKPGCSREFYRVADDFPEEVRRGETIMVTRG
jgi:FkbM family methyltransferase